MMLNVERAVKVSVDMLPKVDRIVSSSDGIKEVSTVSPDGQRIPEGSLALVDMQDIYVSLLRGKEIPQVAQHGDIPGRAGGNTEERPIRDSGRRLHTEAPLMDGRAPPGRKPRRPWC